MHPLPVGIRCSKNQAGVKGSKERTQPSCRTYNRTAFHQSGSAVSGLFQSIHKTPPVWGRRFGLLSFIFEMIKGIHAMERTGLQFFSSSTRRQYERLLPGSSSPVRPGYDLQSLMPAGMWKLYAGAGRALWFLINKTLFIPVLTC